MSSSHSIILSQQVAALNDEGVTLLSQGGEQSRLAFKYFSEALRHVQEISKCPMLPGDLDDLPSISGGSIIDTLNDDTHFFVYNQAFVVYPLHPDESMTSNHVYLYLSALLFNVSLTFHLQGKRMSSPFYLHEARRHYKMSLDIIHQIPMFKLSGDLIMMKALALNNLCAIHMQLSEIPEFCEQLHEVRLLWPSVLAGGCRFAAFAKRGLLGEVLLNTLVSSPSDCSCAPCA